MENNPFSALIEDIRNDNRAMVPANYRFGTVFSTNPLVVDVAGALQDKDVLLKNDAIVGFEVGETLLLIPIEEEQRYIILCKVVDA